MNHIDQNTQYIRFVKISLRLDKIADEIKSLEKILISVHPKFNSDTCPKNYSNANHGR